MSTDDERSDVRDDEQGLFLLPDDYEQQLVAMALSGFNPYFMMAAKLAVESGQYNEALGQDHVYDESIWSYCDRIKGPEGRDS